MISAVTIAGTNSDDPRGHNVNGSRGEPRGKCDKMGR